MKIHEYQAKEILKSYGIPVPRGRVVETPGEARRAAEEIGGRSFVVKAQIQAGGRGLGDGIKIVFFSEEVAEAAREMIGMVLITPQTGPAGRIVRRVLVEEEIEIQEELYLGITIDRSKARPVVIASREGGIEIEQIASESPGKIVKEWIDPSAGMRPSLAGKITSELGLQPVTAEKFRNILSGLYKSFFEKDCLLAEINPLVTTKEGGLIALDAKMIFDDNGLFRHPEIASLRDTQEEDPLEVEASGYNLNYIKLDGNVGCMVNGAGLAMATMDIIKLAGASPANFLDVGGGATVERVKNGFKILMADPHVKVLFINIFGGILRCDTLAKGVTEASQEMEIHLPIVIRLEGTNMEEGKRILNESGLHFIVAEGMKDGAEKVVKALKSSK